MAVDAEPDLGESADERCLLVQDGSCRCVQRRGVEGKIYRRRDFGCEPRAQMAERGRFAIHDKHVLHRGIAEGTFVDFGSCGTVVLCAGAGRKRCKAEASDHEAAGEGQSVHHLTPTHNRNCPKSPALRPRFHGWTHSCSSGCRSPDHKGTARFRSGDGCGRSVRPGLHPTSAAPDRR